MEVRVHDAGHVARRAIGIVGSEQAKFTPETEAQARARITSILTARRATHVVSGHCHLGGVDIFAEEVADSLGLEKVIFPATTHAWPGRGGYRERNMRIVMTSDEVYCVTVATLPPGFAGMRHPRCYHCGRTSHVKSGGCWTVKQAKMLGKRAGVVVIY